jgi:hypothetical protein
MIGYSKMRQEITDAPGDSTAKDPIPAAVTSSIDLDKEKLKVEREKLAVEKYKARLEAQKTKWTAISVAIPIVVALLTVGYGFWSARETALFQFQMEAAKSVMQSPSPAEANNRLVYYKKLFPKQLPDSFSAVSQEQNTDADEIAIKKEFFKSVLQVRGMTTTQALTIWNALFSGDDWAKSEDLIHAMGDMPKPTVSADGNPQAQHPNAPPTPAVTSPAPPQDGSSQKQSSVPPVQKP